MRQRIVVGVASLRNPFTLSHTRLARGRAPENS